VGAQIDSSPGIKLDLTKNNQKKGTGGMAQVIESLSSKNEVLSSTAPYPSPKKIKREKYIHTQ
jgi:hypothetical protein